ncbi:MAG: DUF6531 domain-containing protein, partial [Clostridia bacterium]
ELHMNERGLNLQSGNYSRSDTDIETKAMGLPFNITRHFNSKSGYTDRNASLGGYWKFNFDCDAKSRTNPGGTVCATFGMPERGSEYFTEGSNPVYPLIGSCGSTFSGSLSSDSGVITTTDQYVYKYDGGKLTEICDPYGNKTKINYAEMYSNDAYATSITDPAGRNYTIEYNVVYPNKHYAKKITCPDGRVVNYTFNGLDLARVYGDVKEERVYEYAAGKAITTKDGAGNILEHGTTGSFTDGFENTYYLKYNGVMRDSNNLQTTKSYTSEGYVDETIDPLGKYTHATYNNIFHGFEDSITDRYQNTTTFTRNATNGNITRTTFPDGSHKDYVYNAQSNVTEERDEDGKKIYYFYDASGKKLIKKVIPLNGTDVYNGSSTGFAVSEYSYYADGELANCPIKGLIKAEKDPEGRTIVYGYDAWGNTSRIRELSSTPTDLNATNLLTLPGKEVTKTYNASGLLTKMVSAGGVTTTYTYDSKKNMLTSTVNGTDTTAYTYDFAGRITKTVTPQYYTGSAKDPGTVCTYYPNGKMKTKTDTCGNTTAFTYDLYGNEKTKTVPNGAVYEYDYDGISRVLHEYITENGEKKALKKYDYDLKLKNDAIAGDGATFFINAVTEYDGLTESAYTKKVMNERRRAIREIRPDGTIEKTEYNNNGTVKKVTNPLGYRTFHAYNGMNLETEKRVEVSTNNFAYTGIIYDGAGRIISEKQGIGYSTEVGVCTNYVTKTKSYYLDGNVKSEETVDGKKITYEYDLDGKPVKKDEYV